MLSVSMWLIIKLTMHCDDSHDIEKAAQQNETPPNILVDPALELDSQENSLAPPALHCLQLYGPFLTSAIPSYMSPRYTKNLHINMT
jgi:hypothetical protein